MRMIITLVASIAILGASPAPADAKWFKKINFTKPVKDGRWGQPIEDVAEKPVDTKWLKRKDAAEDVGRKINEEVVQPIEDAAEIVGRKILEEILQPTEDVAEKPVPERLDFGHVSDK